MVHSEYIPAVVENGGTLKFVCDNYKYQKLCNQAVEKYVDALKYAAECFKTQKIVGLSCSYSSFCNTICS